MRGAGSWDHWVFFTLCVLCFFSSLIWNLSYQAFFNSKCWRIMGLKWFVCVFMFSQLILQMCVWRNCDVFLLLWKEMKVWDYFLLFVLPPHHFLPLFYCTNWNAVQNSAEVLTSIHILICSQSLTSIDLCIGPSAKPIRIHSLSRNWATWFLSYINTVM